MRHLTWLLAAFCSTPAWAGPGKRLAVLELQNPAGLPDEQVAYLTDVVRGAALGAAGERWLVLTRENVLAFLPPGRDLAECEGACEVETGRLLGADLVISGEVVRLGQGLNASLKLHDTRNGALIGLSTRRGADAAALEGELRDASRTLVNDHLEANAEAFTLTRLPDVPPAGPPPPMAHRLDGLKFDAVDVDTLELYDRAARLERTPGVEPELKAEAWQALAERAPRYRALAEERAAAWQRHAAARRAELTARQAREEAMRNDWTKLSRLLRLEVVPDADKQRWAKLFVDAYADLPPMPTLMPTLSEWIDRPAADEQGTPDELYRRGWSRLQRGGCAHARPVLDTLIRKHPDHPRADNALYLMAECQFRDRNHTASISTLRSLMAKRGQSEKRDDAMLLMHDNLLALARCDEAEGYLKTLLASHPTRDVLDEARTRLAAHRARCR